MPSTLAEVSFWAVATIGILVVLVVFGLLIWLGWPSDEPTDFPEDP
jgi:hypothetical protein